MTLQEEAGRSTPAKNIFLLSITFLLAVFAMETHSAAAEEAHAVYKVLDLVSNVPGQATYTDSSLNNPWGLASDARGLLWVANEGKGRVTYYSGNGVSLPALSPLVITVPVNPGGIYDYSTPMGVLFNDTSDFELAPDVPAKLLIVTRDGTIVGWSGDAYEYNVVLLVDNSPEAVYTGAAIAGERGNLLYVANFGQRRIETYGTDFSAVHLGDNAFNDPLIPDGFSPYNIQNINGMLFVTYAMPLQGKGIAAAGEGTGYIDAFDPEGALILRLQHGPWMDAPWGMALSPEDFGDFNGRLLVGNSGSGRIASFDPLTGEFLGYLPGEGGFPISIQGLHGLGFGNDDIAGPATSFFFTAGSYTGGKSIFGTIFVSARPDVQGSGPVIVPRMNY